MVSKGQGDLAGWLVDGIGDGFFVTIPLIHQLPGSVPSPLTQQLAGPVAASFAVVPVGAGYVLLGEAGVERGGFQPLFYFRSTWELGPLFPWPH